MLQPGHVFAHFKIIRHLGTGGMGEVYLAEDQKLHRPVALKILLAKFFGEQERLLRFEREAKTAAQVSHQYVMSIYDMGVAEHPVKKEDVHYIVMERVQGRQLFDYLRDHQLDTGQMIHLAEKIASGLSAAHKLNIVHRDIKSANILIDDEGNPKILDFGLAKPIEPVMTDEDADPNTVSAELTKAGKIVGTVSYMSPEQARGDTVDVRSDIFSFGVLLYRMVTGEFPFAGPSQVETLAKILESRPEAPSGKRADVPPELERIIDKCLRKDPNDRYQSAADLLVDLRNLRRQHGSGVTDSVSGVTSAAGTTANVFSTSWLKLLFGLAVLSVMALLIMNYFESPDSQAELATSVPGNALAVISFENKTGDDQYTWLETGLPEILITDLAQTEAITVISGERIQDYLIRNAGATENGFTYSDKIRAARSLGAKNILTGSLYQLGARFRIDARLEDVGTGQITLAEKVMGDDPFALVDSLTKKIASSLNVSETVATSSSVASVTTSSSEAYRLYHEGMELFLKERHDGAIEKFSQAIEIDSTFALAYMRIGMANVFSGRQQEGAAYLAQARQYRDKLPSRERSMVDLYAKIWVDEQFDEANYMIKSFVDNYPDDIEGRTFYAIFLNVFSKDTTACFAQLDTVLQQVPTYQLALSYYVQVYERYKMLTQAISYARRLKDYHPDSPEPYLRLGNLYRSELRYDEAIEEFEQALNRFPDESAPYARISRIYILKQDFKKSREYLEKYKEQCTDNKYCWMEYYSGRANLEDWSGSFQTGMDYRFRALEESFKTGDSILIMVAYQSIATYYSRFDMTDSAFFYSAESNKWSNGFRLINHPLQTAGMDPSKCPLVREQFESAIRLFRERFPSEMWSFLDNIELVFEAYCEADTARLVTALRQTIASQQEGQTQSDERQIGICLVLTGHFEEGKKILERFVSGPDEVTSGYLYPYLQYLIGLANEGLGNNKAAIEDYQTMLKYWADPEIDLKEIKDARERLARLTS